MLRRRLIPLFCLIVLALLTFATSAQAKGEADGLEYLYWLLFGSAGAAAGVVYVKKRDGESVAASMDAINTEIAKLDGRRVEAGQDADLTVFAPDYGSSGKPITIQAVVHFPLDQQQAYGIASSNDPDAKQLGSVSLAIQLNHNDLIKLTLEAKLSVISEPVQSLHWNGRMVCFVFDVKLPDVDQRMPDQFSLRAAVNGVPVGRVLFKIQVGTELWERRNSRSYRITEPTNELSCPMRRKTAHKCCGPRSSSRRSGWTISRIF
jgi:hypothetical protein